MLRLSLLLQALAVSARSFISFDASDEAVSMVQRLPRAIAKWTKPRPWEVNNYVVANYHKSGNRLSTKLAMLGTEKRRPGTRLGPFPDYWRSSSFFFPAGFSKWRRSSHLSYLGCNLQGFPDSLLDSMPHARTMRESHSGGPS